MTRDELLAILDEASADLRTEIEARRVGELPRRIERDLKSVTRLEEARAAVVALYDAFDGATDDIVRLTQQVAQACAERNAAETELAEHLADHAAVTAIAVNVGGDTIYVPTQHAKTITDALALRARVEAAPVVWAGKNLAGEWFAGADWRDADHVRLHLSGFGDAAEQAAIEVARVRLLVEHERCDCPCHQPGEVVMHFMPCCDGNGEG